jgi:hypothetical protein
VGEGGVLVFLQALSTIKTGKSPSNFQSNENFLKFLRQLLRYKVPWSKTKKNNTFCQHRSLLKQCYCAAYDILKKWPIGVFFYYTQLYTCIFWKSGQLAFSFSDVGLGFEDTYCVLLMEVKTAIGSVCSSGTFTIWIIGDQPDQWNETNLEINRGKIIFTNVKSGLEIKWSK